MKITVLRNDETDRPSYGCGNCEYHEGSVPPDTAVHAGTTPEKVGKSGEVLADAFGPLR